MKLQVFGVMILEKDLTEKLMKAHSIDDTLHRKDISYVGEIQRGDRLYKLYVSPFDENMFGLYNGIKSNILS